MTFNPYDSPMPAGEPPEKKPAGWRPTLIELLVMIGVITMFVALLLPARRTAGEAARRTQCSNNLKQVGLALLNYESVHDSLPPAYTVDADGKPLHSWRTLILPYMEQEAVYDKVDLSKPWDDPANREARETTLHVYRCPSAVCPEGHTTYLAMVAAGGCFQPAQPRKLSEITDNHGATLMVLEVEAERAVHWMSPMDASENDLLNLRSAARLAHPGGAQAVCVDGRTLFVTPNFTAEQLRALISIAGNDDAVFDAAN